MEELVNTSTAVGNHRWSMQRSIINNLVTVGSVVSTTALGPVPLSSGQYYSGPVALSSHQWSVVSGQYYHGIVTLASME